MHVPTTPLLRLIACLALAWQPSAAFAQNEDVQFWTYAIATGDLDEDMQLTVDATWRVRERALADDQQTLRVTIEQAIGDGLQIGGGLAVFDADGLTELRPHQQIRIATGRVSSLTRLEQRFFDQADRMELRLRQRLRYTQPITARLSASVSGEYLRLLQTREREIGLPRDEWRGRATVEFEASDALVLGASYLAIYTPQPGDTDRLSHVPQALVTYRF